LSDTPRKVEEMPAGGISLNRGQPAPFETYGEQLPFFGSTRLVWTTNQFNNMNVYQVKLVDRPKDEELWTVAGPANSGGVNTSGHLVPCFLRGHLAVLYLGHMVYGLDVVDHKELWKRDLVNADRYTYEQPYQQPRLLHLRPDGFYLAHPNNTMELLGGIGPVADSFVCLRTAQGLVALDSIRGTELWSLPEFSTRTRLFGDNELIYLVDVKEEYDGKERKWKERGVTNGRALRGRDGTSFPVRDFAKEYQNRIRSIDENFRGVMEKPWTVDAIFRGRILVLDPGNDGTRTLHLYDIVRGQDLWKKTLDAKAVVVESDNPKLAGVVEADGKVTLVDMGDGREIFHAALLPSHLQGVKTVLVLSDNSHYYLALNQPPQRQTEAMGPWNNVTYTLRTRDVNGYFYAFDRETGKLSWRSSGPVAHQKILLDEFNDLPVVLFIARYQKPVAVTNTYTHVCGILSFDKKTGKRLYDKEVGSGRLQPFHTLKVDRQAGTIDLISNTWRLRHYLGGNVLTAARPAPRQSD
jgi:outer membrane protein assembly factor BamB